MIGNKTITFHIKYMYQSNNIQIVQQAYHKYNRRKQIICSKYQAREYAMCSLCEQIQIMEGYIAKIIIPMLKNQTVNTNQRDFVLAKIRPSPQETHLVVNFQPLQRPNLTFESITPRFNHDRCHFTPAFVLPSDQKFYQENASFERLKFEDRIQNAREKNITENNYKFVPTCNYCQLCGANFEDYIQHTQTQQHSNQIAASFANIYIEELATTFLHKTVSKRKIMKKSRKERGKSGAKKNSCNFLKDNITHMVKPNKGSLVDSKNSNQSTQLISLSC